MRRLWRFAILSTALAALAPMASAYYYWIYFANHNGPFIPVAARFDTANLPNQSIPMLISSAGPTAMMPGDSFNALISQIRLAADEWNSVPTSAAKLKFAGLSPMTSANATPEVDVVFDNNITPGLLAVTRITTVQDVAGTLANGATFVPVVNARVQFYSDLTLNQQSSFSDSFFLTIVHELGHALGLQHTLTSSVMSTQATSAVTKAVPLTADDMAGISLLYPSKSYAGTTGSITGTVQLKGSGVNMASVVALSLNGTAVSGVTNPDGTYRIDGIPAGAYYVYTHPLPPSAFGEAYPDNMFPPQDAGGFQYLANTGFGSQFLGGTTDWTQTTPINITAGQEVDGINFNVSSRPGGPAVSTITTYGELGPTGQACTASFCYFVPSPPIQAGAPVNLAFRGNGIVTSKNVATPGLQVSVIGGTALAYGGLNPYPGSPGYIYTSIQPVAKIPSYTPVALAFQLNGDLYVLPNAFSVVPSAPPSISSVNGSTDGNGNATVTIAGANLNANTKILFDGSAAAISQVNQDGSLTVTAPPAAAGYKAVVEALGTDSQTSAQLLGLAAPPAFVYGGPGTPSISVNPPVVTAGTDTTVEITGSNTNFIDGQTVVGFGSSDVTITHVWVVSPGLLQMNISVNAAAAAAPVSLTVASGLQLATLNSSLQIAAPNAGQITLRTPITNLATGLAGVPVGGSAVINTSNLPFTASSGSLTGWNLTIASQPAPFTVGDHGQLTVQVPGGLLTGPTTVQLTPANGAFVPPVLMQVDPPAPVITAAVDVAPGISASASVNVIHAGDPISLNVAGFADGFGNFPAAPKVVVTIGGIDVTPTSLTSNNDPTATCRIQVVVPASLAAGPQTVTVRYSTRQSAPATITLQ